MLCSMFIYTISSYTHVGLYKERSTLEYRTYDISVCSIVHSVFPGLINACVSLFLVIITRKTLDWGGGVGKVVLAQRNIFWCKNIGDDQTYYSLRSTIIRILTVFCLD